MGVGKFFLGGTKNVKFVFPSRNEENNLFSWNFQNPGGALDLPCPPSDAHGCTYNRYVYCFTI